MENSVLDLWSIIDFLMPGYLGTATDFRERYELPITRDKDEAMQARLGRRLRPFLLRRLKTEVAKDLPAKLEQVSYCELTDDQAEIYKQVLAVSRKEIANPRAVELNALLANLEKMMKPLLGEDIDLAILPGANLGLVRADPGGHDHLQILRHREPLSRHIGGPERLRDDYVGVSEFALEGGVRAILVGRDHELMPGGLQERPQPELARDTTQQLAWLEVDCTRRRKRLTIRIAFKLRKVVSRVAGGITADGVVVQNAQYLRHEGAFRLPSKGTALGYALVAHPRAGRGF
jgi:hypothetical protein